MVVSEGLWIVTVADFKRGLAAWCAGRVVVFALYVVRTKVEQAWSRICSLWALGRVEGAVSLLVGVSET